MKHVPISLCASEPLLFKVVLLPNISHCTTTVNVWERIGEKDLGPLCIPCERGGMSCNPIFSTNIAKDAKKDILYVFFVDIVINVITH